MATGRSRVADALRTLELSEARWQAVLDTARDAIISIDASGRVTLFNHEAQSMFGYTAAEVVGNDVTMLMPTPYRDEHGQYIRNYQDTGVPKAIGFVRQVEARRKNTEVFPIELSVSEARVGEEVIYTAIIRDVSERRRAETELQQLHRTTQERERLADIGAITAKIVHDLGNPLAGLSMQAQLLLRRLRKSEAASADALREPTERILATVRHLDKLTAEFMSFAREQRLELKRVVLPRFLHQLVDLWHPVAAARDIRLLLTGEQVNNIRADEVQLKRVFDNLLKNAIEAIDHDAGQIRILVTERQMEWVRISVEDNGSGFPSSVECFRLFQTTKPKGTGLGLAVARQIVLAHGGEIGFGPACPHGTVFHIDLPRHGPQS